MRSLNSLPLDDDILDQIFLFCPDFDTLNALQLTAKALRRVFLAHPISIHAAVAHNLTGPAFPEALRYLCVGLVDPEDDPNSDVPLVATSPLTAGERFQLAQNATVVRKLENLFSQWYKDRKLASSVLTPGESFRFRRAMYRIMLYSTRFSALAYSEDEAFDMADDSETMTKIVGDRLKMLSEYATADLREIHTVVVFLKQAVDWVRQDVENPHGYDDKEQVPDICLAAGAALILATYEARDMDVMENACPMVDSFGDIPLFVGFFSHPLEHIWESRNVAAPPDNAEHLASILEVVPPSLDTCSRCTNSRTRLWTSATWHHLLVDTPTLLPGKLPLNRHETDLLHRILHPHDPHVPTTDVLVAEIFRDVPLRPGFEGWTAQDALCGACLHKLLGAHTYLWLRGRRAQDEPRVDGSDVDCCYGYDCRTQYKDAEHARTTNHLCEPTQHWTE
ncbi:hypothetical protein C8R46DRAFT_36541 [Mycena filopes]|nr:hypothetical protein C8R46DRAFT_36541 [Mycena filopes]